MIKLSSKVAYNRPIFFLFSTANLPKTSPNLNICSIKIAHPATYMLTVDVYDLAFDATEFDFLLKSC